MKNAIRLAILTGLLCAAGLAVDISGTWSASVETDAGTGTPTFVLKQDGEKLTGSYTGALGEAKITGTVKGDRVEIEFRGDAGGETIKVRYSGTIESPTKMKGTVELGTIGKGTWTATRK